MPQTEGSCLCPDLCPKILDVQKNTYHNLESLRFLRLLECCRVGLGRDYWFCKPCSIRTGRSLKKIPAGRTLPKCPCLHPPENFLQLKPRAASMFAATATQLIFAGEPGGAFFSQTIYLSAR
ncbi:MAG: hypothetical protein JWN66_3281 [Sphingomonas bacterium]|nr:hypothetical protein [Sphingomonas bacterium]